MRMSATEAPNRGPLRDLLRLSVISWALFSEYRALRRYIHRANAHAPAHFTARLISLGPAFVKLGQILSTRPDLLPQTYIDSLAALQEHAPEVPAPQITATLEGEFGKPVEEIFTSFDPAPVAAASLAQVHRATLDDGTDVAVKVQRPNIEALILRDLDAIALALRISGFFFGARLQRTNLAAFLAEFRRYTLQELDFTEEGKIIDKFRRNFSGRTDVKFPRVHWSRTTHRVLTMDWIEGMRLDQAERVLDAPTKQHLVRLIVDVMLKMFVSDGLFHADLHPGNIVFHDDGTFTLLDFGMYGELSSSQRDRLVLYWLAVVQRQTRRAFYHFKSLTKVPPGADEQAFSARFAELAETFYASPLSEMRFTKVYLEMMKACYTFGFVFPSELMLHAKALTTAETLIFVLAPDARFERLSRPFITREYARRAASLSLVTQRASQLLPELLLLGELPPPEAIDTDWDREATVEVLQGFRGRAESALKGALERGGLWQALLESHLRSNLGATSLADTADAVLADTWELYYKLEPSVPVQPTRGAVFTTHAAALILALHRTLVDHGLAAEESYLVIYKSAWEFYTRMGEPPLLAACAFTRDHRKRLKLATDIFRKFPFGPPSYEWRDVAATDGAVAFDCVKCPMAEFFARHDASELCVETACKLDFPLAEKWGGRLERAGTIASGAPRCDFRWYASS
jgi:ubiquinone biosynthesis protein